MLLGKVKGYYPLDTNVAWVERLGLRDKTHLHLRNGNRSDPYPKIMEIKDMLLANELSERDTVGVNNGNRRYMLSASE